MIKFNHHHHHHQFMDHLGYADGQIPPLTIIIPSPLYHVWNSGRAWVRLAVRYRMNIIFQSSSDFEDHPFCHNQSIMMSEED